MNLELSTAKKRLSNKQFIDSFMLTEHKDQQRRVFVRALPILLMVDAILCGLGWWLGSYSIWLSYLFFGIVAIVTIYIVFRMMLPQLKGPLSIYYGTHNIYKENIGIIIPLKTTGIKNVSKKWGWTEYEYENVRKEIFHFVFVLAYHKAVEDDIITSEVEKIRMFLDENPDVGYSELRKKFRTENYKARILYVLSDRTGFIPDEYAYYRSYGIPRIDNISIYHREHLAPYALILGYSKDNDHQFFPFYKDMWKPEQSG